VALRTADGRPLPLPPHVVCIGPTTAATARAAGLDNVYEARDASAQGIVDELIEALGPGADDGP
jgi:uroporphyrinogen-III synthase